MSLLEVKNLGVEVEGKRIIDSIDINIERGETYALFGPNGSGKTSLVNTIMGIPKYKVVSGSIFFDGVDVTHKSINERAKLGMVLAFQMPPEITGVKLIDLLKICAGISHKDELSAEHISLVKKLGMINFLDRDINRGFSGGERKRAEILQILFMKPKLMLLDEPDSGVDAESLKVLGTAIQEYLSEYNASAMIITHHGQILDYIHAKKSCVLMEKIVYCNAPPKEIIKSIKEHGYEGCLECHKRRMSNE